jgi:hypothetical protein
MRHMVSHNFKHGALPTTDIVISTHQHSGTKSQTTLLWAAPPSRRTIKRRATARQLVLNPVITTVRFVQSVAYSSAIVQRQQEGQRFGRAKFECRYQYRHQTPPLQPRPSPLSPNNHLLHRSRWPGSLCSTQSSQPYDSSYRRKFLRDGIQRQLDGQRFGAQFCCRNQQIHHLQSLLRFYHSTRTSSCCGESCFCVTVVTRHNAEGPWHESKTVTPCFRSVMRS